MSETMKHDTDMAMCITQLSHNMTAKLGSGWRQCKALDTLHSVS